MRTHRPTLFCLVVFSCAAQGGFADSVTKAEGATARDARGRVVLTALYAPSPKYPNSALAQHTGGEGVFGLVLRADGSVSSVIVLQTTGRQDLDDAGKRALITWRFSRPPSEIKGVKVPLNFEYPHVTLGNYGPLK